MYVILVYDMEQKRIGKMLKLCRRYLNWIQNSVFEGEITEVQLKELLYEARRIMNEEEDSLILFKNRDQRWLEKEIVGQERSRIDDFL
ncbi:CRISPR-associated endonuclease Cas2 [Larkinella bovis]|uniref:CRISPR-associated endoribonuclease Cas2 n=1 Tax=Larkinella bovis TaxID=683041 RepID=A0ABW0I2E1_9BACT